MKRLSQAAPAHALAPDGEKSTLKKKKKKTGKPHAGNLVYEIFAAMFSK